MSAGRNLSRFNKAGSKQPKSGKFFPVMNIFAIVQA